MEKFKKYMDILDKVLKAFNIAFLVLAIVMVVFSVVGFIGIPNVIIGELEETLTIGILELEVTDGGILDSERINDVLAVSALIAAVQFAVAYVFVRILRKLISPVIEGNIFHPAVAENIKKLAIYVLIGGFISELLNFAGSAVVLAAYDLSAMFNEGLVANHSLTFEMNDNFIVYAGIIYLLSFVFKYGAELQTQVDETL